MTIEDFKDVYKDKPPLEKLKLLIVQTDYIRNDVRSMERDRINGNEKGAAYMRSEIRAKEERIQWLYDQLASVLKAQEPIEPSPAIDNYGNWFCGKCYNSVIGTEELDEGGFVPIRFNYCPNCGQAVKWDD